MTPDKAQLVRELDEGGFPPEAIAVLLGVSVDDVHEELRRLGARMDAEWQPPMRPHTKMLEPEAQN